MKLLLFALFVAVWLESIHAATTTPIPTHLWPSNLPLVHPFKITCYNDSSVGIHQNTSYHLDLFVTGNVPSPCPNRTNHFTIDDKDVNLTSSCMDTKEGAFLIEAHNRTLPTISTGKKTVMGGIGSIVYRVTCIPDTNGDPVSVSIVPPVSVKATASELVLPALKIGVFEGSPAPDLQKPQNSLTLGKEVKLVVYNDLRGKRMSYMLIPSTCSAYPQGHKKDALLSLLEDSTTNTQCTHEDKLLSTFNVPKMNEYDMAYATLYPFKFEGYPGAPVVLECTVYICPNDDAVDGIRTGHCEKRSLNSGSRCSLVSPTSGYSKKRRRRDVGVGDSGVGRATLRATFSVQEPLVASASRCFTGIWGLVALVYIFM
ncbi:uncharacterized protein [Haliotis asinina]|uniref:uncharacterized protein n=1 Tax=Haliotis asinina TaxID=109174 RepID=UPI003531A2B1